MGFLKVASAFALPDGLLRPEFVLPPRELGRRARGRRRGYDFLKARQGPGDPLKKSLAALMAC